MSYDPLIRPLRYRWLIFGVLSAGYFLVYFHRLCPAVVALDMMQDLHAGGTLTGLMSSAYFYPYALMQVPSGLLADSWGPRKSISLFFVVAATGSFLLGFAPSAFWAVAGRALVGLGVAVLFVSTLKVLAEWFRPREFATMAGVLNVVGGIGFLSATAPLAMLSGRIGWRWSFFIMGGLTLIVSLLTWCVVRNRPEDAGRPSLVQPGDSRPPPIPLLQGVRRVLTTPSFWPIAAWFFFAEGIFYGFGGLWGGPFLMQVHGLSKEEAGRVLSMIALGMIFGSPLLTFLSNRIFKARKPVVVLSSAMLALLSAALAFFTSSLSLPQLYLLCLGIGVFSVAVVIIAFTMVKESFPLAMAGTAIGLVNFFPFFSGAVFQPLLGYILERQGQVQGSFTPAGYHQAFMVLFWACAVALICSLCLKETMEHPDQPR